MPSAISGQMRSNLIALTSLNDDLAVTQNRLSTGKKVNTALDDQSVYFKALSLNNRASALESVNNDIGLGVSNIAVADQAMTTMLKNIDAQIATLTDAKAKAVTTAATAVSTQGFLTWATGAGSSMVGTAANDPNTFQNGDQLEFSIRDTTGNVKTAYFQAATTVPATQGAGTAASRWQFNTVQDLFDGLKAVFGSSTLTASMTATTNGAIKLQLADNASTLSIKQTTNAGGATAGVVADLQNIFSGGGAATGNQVPDSVALATTGQTVTYNPKAGSVNQDALDVRTAAANSFIKLLQQHNSLLDSATVNGQTNLLKPPGAGGVANGTAQTGGVPTQATTTAAAASMVFKINEDGGTATVAISQALDLGSLNLRFNGTANTSADTGNNFNTDASIDDAVARLTNAKSKITAAQRQLSQQKSFIDNRLSFNKSLVNNLKTNADTLTAADAAAEAATQAAIQTRQSFATNNLSVTKQSESGLIQLLR